MQPLRRIVVGIDFSPESELALAHARELARTTEAEMVLVHVCPEPIEVAAAAAPGGGLAVSYTELSSVQSERDRADLAALVEQLRDTGLSAAPLVVEGHADSGLVEAAVHVEADLIIIGTHGRTGFKRLLLGSVAEKTVRMAETDVLVVRRPPPQAGGYRRILVPTDFSTTAERALQRALALAGPDATVELLHCWSVPVVTGDAAVLGPVGPTQIEPLRRDLQEGAQAQGERLIARYASAGVDLRFAQREDTPSHGIQVHLKAGEFELVVMGSHGRRGLRRWLLGSVSEATVRHVGSSVLVVHAGEDDHER